MSSNHNISMDLLQSDYHYRKLEKEHEHVERVLTKMKQAFVFDDIEVRRLKQQKLSLRDKMHHIAKERLH
jgi:uncharacterized protein YdcH (DUF465 family)